VDLTGGRVIKSLAGFKDSQDALFLGGDFNKLYVSSLDGHVRVFQGESFWLVQELRGMNVGILQPKPGTGYDRLVADMIATTPRPGHTTQCGKRSPWSPGITWKRHYINFTHSDIWLVSPDSHDEYPVYQTYSDFWGKLPLKPSSFVDFS
jgi:hypothetical protein